MPVRLVKGAYLIHEREMARSGGLKYAGRRFRELSGSDNALARTMRGDFSGVEGFPPSFTGDMDIADGAKEVRPLIIFLRSCSLVLASRLSSRNLR